MIEITAEIRALIDKAAAGVELAGDEYIDPSDGLIEAILQKLIAKQNCDIDSFEVKELVGEYGFVMKQLAQIKEEKGFMMAQTQYYRNEQIKPMIDEKYGEGASDFFAQAIENYYKVK